MDSGPACARLGGFEIGIYLSMLGFISFTEKCGKRGVTFRYRSATAIFVLVEVVLFLMASVVPGNRMICGPF
jgi:hypothetical protein